MTLKKWYGVLVLSFLILAATYGAYVNTPTNNFGDSESGKDPQSEVLGSSTRGYKMPVYVLTYIPVNAANEIDKTVTGEMNYSKPSDLLAYVKTISKKVILMDGEQLASYMIEYGLGVSTFATYELKKIDNDYFGE